MNDSDSRDACKMAENMIFFLKDIFRTNIQCLIMFQEQNALIFNTWIDRGLFAQQEVVFRLREWSDNSIKSTRDFQTLMEENFDKLEEFFK